MHSYSDQKHSNLISLIHEKLPVKEKDRRGQKEGNLSRISKLKDELKILLDTKKEPLSRGGGICLKSYVKSLIQSFRLNQPKM